MTRAGRSCRKDRTNRRLPYCQCRKDMGCRSPTVQDTSSSPIRLSIASVILQHPLVGMGKGDNPFPAPFAFLGVAIPCAIETSDTPFCAIRHPVLLLVSHFSPMRAKQDISIGAGLGRVRPVTIESGILLASSLRLSSLPHYTTPLILCQPISPSPLPQTIQGLFAASRPDRTQRLRGVRVYTHSFSHPHTLL